VRQLQEISPLSCAGEDRDEGNRRLHCSLSVNHMVPDIHRLSLSNLQPLESLQEALRVWFMPVDVLTPDYCREKVGRMEPI